MESQKPSEQVEYLYSEIKDGLIRLRKTKGLSQSDLSIKSGNKASHIGGIERGENELMYDSFYKIAMSLGLSTKELLKEISPKRPDYVVTRYNSISKSYKPRLVERYGFSKEHEKLIFFSLLEQEGQERKMITDFQMNLVSFQGNSEGIIGHYHPGVEIAFILEGQINFQYLLMNAGSKNDWRDIQLYKDKEHFISFDSSIPHKYQSEVPSKVLTILDDPRGEAGLYTYRELPNKQTRIDQIYSYDESKSKSSSIANSFGFKLRHQRLNLGLSIQELSHRTEIIPSRITRFEKNELVPSLKEILTLSIFGLDSSPTVLMSDREHEDLFIKAKSQKEVEHFEKVVFSGAFSGCKGKKLIQYKSGLNVTYVKGSRRDSISYSALPHDFSIFMLSGNVNVHVKKEDNIHDTIQSSKPTVENLNKWDVLYLSKDRLFGLEFLEEAEFLYINKYG